MKHGLVILSLAGALSISSCAKEARSSERKAAGGRSRTVVPELLAPRHPTTLKEIAMRVIAVVLMLALLVGPAFAQHSMSHSGGASSLHPGLGNHHHPITTENAEAQTFF